MPNAENKQNYDSGANDAESHKIVAQYLIHLRTLTIVRHILPTVIASQQHRGAALALLEGDTTYESKVGMLEEEIDYRLATLNLINSELSCPIKGQELENIGQEWLNVKTWSEGPILENYNLHSHFIDQQMSVCWRTAENGNLFFSLDIINEIGGDEITNDALLARVILYETPKLIELIARIRGLATHASVLGRCDNEHHSRLKYLIRELNRKKEKFRLLSKSLYKYKLKDLPSLINLQMQDIKIVQLIQLVEEKILRENDIGRHNRDIFSMATNIITSHSEVVYQGLDYIQNKIHRTYEEKQLCLWQGNFS